MNFMYRLPVVALAAGAFAATAALSFDPDSDRTESLLFGKVIEGPGLAKAIQIKVPTTRHGSYKNVRVYLARNGRPFGEDNAKTFLGILENTVTICSKEAMEQDIGGFLCGEDPRVFSSEQSLLTFNGNDMLVLVVEEENGVDTVVDIFGNDSGKNFEICGRKNANIKSILTRRESVKYGQRVQLSANTPCEWDWAPLTFPLPLQPFSEEFVFRPPVERSSIRLYDDDIDVNELFLSSPNTAPIRIKDMEKGNRGDFRRGTSVCIKQESYIAGQANLCNYLWDADLGATDPLTGGPIPFNFTVSGEYKRNLPRVRSSLHNLRYLPECAVTQENPIDTVFKNYVYNFSCYDDCATVGKQWNDEAVCTVFYRPGYDNGGGEYVEGYNESLCALKVESRWQENRCYVDGECVPNNYCTFFYDQNYCKGREMRMQVRSTNADNMVIPAGESREVYFYINSDYGTVGEPGRIHFVTTAIADLSYEVTVAQSEDVIGSGRTLAGVCESNEVEVEEGAPTYYRISGSAYLQSDDTFLGDWVYKVKNEGTEDVTLLGVFKDFETRYD